MRTMNHQPLVFSSWCARRTLQFTYRHVYTRHAGMFVAGIHLLAWHPTKEISYLADNSLIDSHYSI